MPTVFIQNKDCAQTMSCDFVWLRLVKKVEGRGKDYKESECINHMIDEGETDDKECGLSLIKR